MQIGRSRNPTGRLQTFYSRHARNSYGLQMDQYGLRTVGRRRHRVRPARSDPGTPALRTKMTMTMEMTCLGSGQSDRWRAIMVAR